MRRLALIAALLVGCQAQQDTGGVPVQVNTHCGLYYVVIEYAGSTWRFQSVPEPRGVAPPGWPQVATVYVERVGGRVVAHGPDGKDWGLVQGLDPNQPCL